jgi:hypothetical protein
MKPVDLKGRKFGRLTVIKDSGKRSHRAVLWEAECECGKTILVTGNSLKRGNTKSCGCLNKEVQKQLGEKIKSEKTKNDLNGQKFGKLTVIKIRTGHKSNNTKLGAYWECKCECGNEIIVQRQHLLRKGVVSCGCKQRENASIAIETLRENCFKENTHLGKLNNGLQKNNTSGIRGVSYDQGKQKWIVTIGFQKRNMKMGQFNNIEEAIKARKLAEEKYFQPILEKYNRPISISI